jgi:hypothetical protein
MLYKMLVSCIIAAISIIFLSGCGEYLNEKKKESEVLNFSSDRLLCLKELPLSFGKISIGEGRSEDINSSFDCARDALSYFKNKTFGSLPNGYTPDELRRFFSKYFLKENQVTPEFAAELMKIKQALLGGSEAVITKAEIDQLVDLLGIVKTESVALSPSMKLLLMKQKTAEWDEISRATSQLISSVLKILGKTEIVKSEYGVEDLKRALSGLSDFLRGPEAKSSFDISYDKFKGLVPLLDAIKNVLVGKKADFSTASEWRNGIQTFIQAYDLYLKYNFTINKKSLEKGKDTQALSVFIDGLLELLERSPQLQMRGLIPAQEIDAFIDEIVPRLELNPKIKTSTFKKTYRVVVMRMLGRDQDFIEKVDFRRFIGFENKHLGSLRHEFKIWKMIQEFVDSTFQQKSPKTMLHKDFMVQMRSYFAQSDSDRWKNENLLEQEMLKKAQDEFYQLLSSQVPINFNKKGRWIESAHNGNETLTWLTLTKLNLFRGLGRLLLIGYGANSLGSLTHAELKEAGFSTWYDDFNELGLDLKAFDPRKGNSGPSSFIEANLFTPSANGDTVMDYKETFEYVSLLFSVGLATSEQIQNDLEVCKIKKTDVFGYFYQRETCVKKQLRLKFADYFDNLPGMSRYVAKLTDPEFDEFFKYLKAASLVDGQIVGLLETENIRTMVTVLHYVEALIIAFDRDGNQTLSINEVASAAPRFNLIIKKLNPGRSDMLLHRGLVYLVFVGNIPSATELLGFELKKHFIQEASRKDVLRIFGTLKLELKLK